MDLDLGLTILRHGPSGGGSRRNSSIERGGILLGIPGSDPAAAQAGTEDDAFFERAARRAHSRIERPETAADRSGTGSDEIRLATSSG